MKAVIRYITFAVIVVASAITASARTAADFFAAAPDSVMPLLTGVTRLDMCDYHAAGSTRPSANRLGGHSRVTSQAPLLIEYELTDSASGQLGVLIAGADTVLVVNTTLHLPAPDSEVALYDTAWRRIPAAGIMPRYTDWLTPEGRADIDRASSLVPFVTAEAAVDPEARTLILTGGAAVYVAPSMRDEVARMFVPQITVSLVGIKPRSR